MELGFADYVLWVSTSFLQVFVCVLVIQRGLARRLPFFTIYLTLVALRGLSLWGIYHAVGYESNGAFYFFWSTAGVLLVARWLVIAEVCWVTLRLYRGLWALAWRLLLCVGLILVVHAAMSASQHTAWISQFLLTAERGLALAVVGTVVMLLLMCRYYGIRMETIPLLAAAGLGVYSGIQVINDSLMWVWLGDYFPVWNTLRSVSFQGVLLLWCWALRKPVPAPQPAPALLDQRVYDTLTPQVSYRLRELNSRLLEMLRG